MKIVHMGARVLAAASVALGSASTASAGEAPADGEVALDYEVAPGLEKECFTEDQFRYAAGLRRVELFTPKGAPGRYLLKVAFR